MNVEQINALNRFALSYRGAWKERLRKSWHSGEYPLRTPPADRALLQQLRNDDGPLILPRFKARERGYRGVALLKRGHMERFNMKRSWFVTVWRLVDEADTDMVQPWCASKTEAREAADTLGLFIAGEKE